MLRANRFLTGVMLAALLVGGCRPISAPPSGYWPQSAAPQNLALIGHLGGPTTAIVIQDQYAYVGFYAEFAIFTLADPLKPVRTGS